MCSPVNPPTCTYVQRVSSEVLRVKSRLLPQTRTFLLSNHQNMMVQLCGLHTTVTLFTHGPSTRSLCVQPVWSHEDTFVVPGRYCVYSHLVVTRGYLWTQCWSLCVYSVTLSHVVTREHSPQSQLLHCHMCSHVDGAPSHCV